MRRDPEKKRAREQRVVEEMITLYCRAHHHRGTRCAQCEELAEYAPDAHGEMPRSWRTKTFCSNCRVHCYDQAHRQRIKEVMRFSGPRMLMHHPLLALSHLIESKKEQRRLKEEKPMRMVYILGGVIAFALGTVGTRAAGIAHCAVLLACDMVLCEKLAPAS